MPEFFEWFRERLTILARLAAQMILDAILFVLWLGIAWIMQIIADYFSRIGLHEYFALIFKWTSSFGILVLTILYIARDIKIALAALFSPADAD
jgi:hypothetical protein